MNPREFLELQLSTFGEHAFLRFMLTYARDYQIGPDTFAGPRAEARACYRNAALLAFDDDAMTYVEGQVATCGIAIDHAWCVDKDGVVIDPTLDASRADDTFTRVGGYFGVPFRTDYLRKAVLANERYGLLDIFSAPKTLPKLVELGLEAGQQWLLDQIRRKRRKA